MNEHLFAVAVACGMRLEGDGPCENDWVLPEQVAWAARDKSRDAYWERQRPGITERMDRARRRQ